MAAASSVCVVVVVCFLAISQFAVYLDASSVQRSVAVDHRSECSSNEVRCDDGVCISLEDLCINDPIHVYCHDGTDLSGACANLTCPRNFVKCRSDGQCIRPQFVCDGQPHCNDATDEMDVHCPNSEPYCSRGEKKCPGLHMCIARSHFCDGENDCINNSDEDPVLCHAERTCLPSEVRCDNGQCVDGQQFCRHQAMSLCADNSLDPRSSNFCTIKCHKSKAKCPGTNQCIKRHHFCDGEDDCDDGSDEDEELCSRRRHQSSDSSEGI